MLFLALTVVCSLAVGAIFKAAALRKLDRMVLLTVNYGVAAGLAFGLLVGAGDAAALRMPPLLVGLGLVTGVFFIGGFFLLSYATATAGMSLALGVMRLSVVIPVVVSWVVWNEVPTVAQQLGLGVACGAFALMAGPARVVRGGAGGKTFLVLGALFLVGGSVDVLLKGYDVAFGSPHGSAGFLLLVFTTACGVGGARIALRRRTGGTQARPAVFWGIALGVVNYGSAAFLLEAVERLRGPVVFPLNNVAIVLGGALLGRLVWQEPLTRRTWAGLGLAVCALMLIGWDVA